MDCSWVLARLSSSCSITNKTKKIYFLLLRYIYYFCEKLKEQIINRIARSGHLEQLLADHIAHVGHVLWRSGRVNIENTYAYSNSNQSINNSMMNMMLIVFVRLFLFT